MNKVAGGSMGLFLLGTVTMWIGLTVSLGTAFLCLPVLGCVAAACVYVICSGVDDVRVDANPFLRIARALKGFAVDLERARSDLTN